MQNNLQTEQSGNMLFSEFMFFGTHNRNIVSKLISTNDGGFSTLLFENVLLSEIPNTAFKSLNDIVIYDLTVNGQYVPKESVFLKQNGKNLEAKVEISSCGYGVESDDFVELIGKVGYGTY